jgi:small multidrug resistance pump
MDKIYLFLAIVFEVIATSALKESDSFKNMIPTIIVGVGYLLSFYFLSIAVKTIPLGIAYALWAGIGIILTVIIGYFYYGQSLNNPTITGIAIILIGTVIVNFNMTR